MRTLCFIGLALPVLAGCDYGATQLGDGTYSLCWTDIRETTTLCRDVEGGGQIGILPSTVVAAGTGERNVTALSCNGDGPGQYWSVRRQTLDEYGDPEILGPLSPSEFEVAHEMDPVAWPAITHRLERLEARYCSRAEG